MCTPSDGAMATETEHETMTEVILALNAGSTSLKFSLFATSRDTDSLSLLYQGEVEGIDGDQGYCQDQATYPASCLL